MSPVLEPMLDPTGKAAGGEDARLAPRDAILRGRRVALLNSTKPNSAVVLEAIGALLEARYGAGPVTMFTKASFAVPADDKIFAEIAERCDYAIAGVGD